jgi:hypothetical protein
MFRIILPKFDLHPAQEPYDIMKWYIFRKGLTVAIILLFIGITFTSSINANVSKSSLETVADGWKKTPLVFYLGFTLKAGITDQPSDSIINMRYFL